MNPKKIEADSNEFEYPREKLSVDFALPKDALKTSQSGDERKNTFEAFSCVMILGSSKVCTFNQENGLYTEWPVIKNVQEEQKSKEQEDQKSKEGDLVLLVDSRDGESFKFRNIDIEKGYSRNHKLL